MTNIVSLAGQFAPTPGTRDTKSNDDNVLASFAGLLAGVNQANAKVVLPLPQADGAAGGDALENADEGTATDNGKTTNDAKDSSTIVATTAVDAGATVVSVTNPNAINSSIAALNPALQQKLARVIERMRDETGHDVQVTETYRSQSRQNTLYAQGRQTDGPVVTWTQSSKHTQGRAVDVIVDGGRASADAYTTLQRIANEEGLRTLGAKDPGHLELPSKSAATSQAFNDVIPVPDVPADASGPGQVSVARLAQIAQTATVEQVTSVGAGSTRAAKLSPTTYMKAVKQPDANVAAPARVARVANVAQVARVANIPAGIRVGGGKHTKHDAPTTVVAITPATATVGVADGDVAPDLFAQADGAADSHNADIVFAKTVASNKDVSLADATGAAGDDDSLTASPTTIAVQSTPGSARSNHDAFEISNLDRLSDAVNATRIQDGSGRAAPSKTANANKARAYSSDAAFAKSGVGPRALSAAGQGNRAAQPTTKATSANGLSLTSGPSIGRSSSDSQSSGDRQSGDGDATGYSPMIIRSDAPQFSVADVSTDSASTAAQRADQIMAAQDAPARPLSQIVMSVDAGNGTTDRIHVALRGSTVNATIDAADQHTANALRAHSDDLVRSLTKDGVGVESVRVRNTATTATAAQVTTVDSSQKSSNTSGNSRFNREAQSDQQRNQQRSNGERRQQQRDQRGGKES